VIGNINHRPQQRAHNHLTSSNAPQGLVSLLCFVPLTKLHRPGHRLPGQRPHPDGALLSSGKKKWMATRPFGNLHQRSKHRIFYDDIYGRPRLQCPPQPSGDSRVRTWLFWQGGTHLRKFNHSSRDPYPPCEKMTRGVGGCDSYRSQRPKPHDNHTFSVVPPLRLRLRRRELSMCPCFHRILLSAIFIPVRTSVGSDAVL